MGREEDSESYYSVLGIRQDSSAAEIRRAYKKLAMKWHPDKCTKNPSLAEQAKLIFQKIQEAYSVLSNATKRVMYDAGLYDSSEDDDEDACVYGFSDFLDELASLMVNVGTQSSREDSFEELQQMFWQMMNGSWFSTDGFEPSEPLPQQPVLSREQEQKQQQQQPEWDNLEIFNELLDNENWDDNFYPDFNLDIEEDNTCSVIQGNQTLEAPQRDVEEYRRQKKPRLCDCDSCKQGTGMGFGGGPPFRFSNERSHINSYPSFTFVI